MNSTSVAFNAKINDDVTNYAAIFGAFEFNIVISVLK